MISDSNRGLYTDVVEIRRKVFAELAKTILEYSSGTLSKIKEEIAKIPFKIINREDPVYRCCVYKERAVVAERVRLALGLPLWSGGLIGPVYTGIEKVLKPERIPELFLVKVISEACEKCPTKAYEVTNNCRLCIAHPCSLVCPVKAISFNETQAVIDQSKCIKCGRCQQACPYQAIVNYDRPCAAACGVDAIESDETGRAKINYGKCVRCGMCIVSCPFGAIADKSEFAQMLIALQQGKKLYAMIAPSIVGQFGPHASPEEIATALVKMGFSGVAEVAYGADVATLQESEEWIHKIMDEKQPFLGTSCCPAWADMARGYFPKISKNISDSHTPMTATGKWIKEKDPDAKVVFIGPCVAKKAESLRPEVAPYVDFVITYEELAAIFVAMEIDLADITEKTPLLHASGSGWHYATSGGVAEALKLTILHRRPDAAVKIARADSLKECKKMILLAQSGKSDANLLEGMACPGGCVGGAGILAPIRRSAQDLEKFSKAVPFYPAHENPEISQSGGNHD